MSEMPGAAPERDYRILSGNAESLAAIEDVVGAAQRTMRVFDFTLANRGFNSPGLAGKLRDFVVAGRANRLLIALHEPDAPRARVPAPAGAPAPVPHVDRDPSHRGRGVQGP